MILVEYVRSASGEDWVGREGKGWKGKEVGAGLDWTDSSPTPSQIEDG